MSSPWARAAARRRRQVPFFFAVPRPDWLRPRLAPTVVQHRSAHGTTSASLSWTPSTTAGNLLVVAAGAITDAGNNSTISTPSGWTLVVGPGASTHVSGYIFYKENAASQAATPTFSAANAGDAIGLFGWEVGGDMGGATATLDKAPTPTNGNGSNQTTPATGTLMQAAEIILAGVFTDNSTAPTTPQNGFALDDSFGNQSTGGGNNQLSGGGLRLIVSATTSKSSGLTAGSNWQAVIASFKGSVAAFVGDEEGMTYLARALW